MKGFGNSGINPTGVIAMSIIKYSALIALAVSGTKVFGRNRNHA
jgi:hypothetical protein